MVDIQSGPLSENSRGKKKKEEGRKKKPQLQNIMAWPPSRAGHYILQLWFLIPSFFFLFSRCVGQVAEGSVGRR